MIPKMNASPRIAHGFESPTFLPIDSPGDAQLSVLIRGQATVNVADSGDRLATRGGELGLVLRRRTEFIPDEHAKADNDDR